MFLHVPPAVLLLIYDSSNNQDFLSFFRWIYTLFQWVSKLTKLDVSKPQNEAVYRTAPATPGLLKSVLITLFFSLCFLSLTSFHLGAIFNPWVRRCMPFSLKKTPSNTKRYQKRRKKMLSFPPKKTVALSLKPL